MRRSTTNPVIWTTAGLASVLPGLPLSRSARAASAIALAAVLGGSFAHEHLRKRLSS